MRRPAKTSLLIFVFVLLFAISASAREHLFVDVYLNTEFKGQFFGFITNEQEILLSKEDLKTLGLNAMGKEEWIDGAPFVPVSSLQPQTTSEFKEKEIALYLMASPDLLDTTAINYHRTAPKGTIEVSNNSAFLNYSLNYSADDSFHFNHFALPLEAGVRVGDFLYYSNATYSEDTEESQFVRLFTNITKDDPKTMRRYVFGDYNASSGELGGGATMGGIKISKNFSLSPYFLISPGLNLQGQLQTPSDVELWRNGTLLDSQQLSPGSFELLNIPLTSGAGEAELLIRDAFGEEQRITYPFYFSSSLLRKGLHEYSYDIGFQRIDFGEESFSYNKPLALFSHQYGFTDAFTGGVRGEIAEHVVSGGMSAGFVANHLGLFSVAFSASDYRGQTGSAAALGYTFSGRHFFSTNFTYRFRSRNYSNLSIEPDQDRSKHELLASLSLNLQPYGSLSFFYSSFEKYLEEDMERLTIRYSKNINRYLGFEISASTIRSNQTENEIFLTLRYNFDQGPSIYASHGRTETEQTSSVTVQKSPPSIRGVGYRLQAEQKKPGQGETVERYDGELSYKSQYGEYAGRATSVDNIENYNLRATGSLSLVNNSFHFGQYIHDGFAVIKVGDLEGVEVSRSNTPFGKTDKNGEVLSSGMISYYANKISINEQDIPMNYQYKDNDEHISLPYRGGAYIELDVQKFQSVIGRLFVKDKLGLKPAEYWRLDLQLKDSVVEAPVGSGGDFYLENLSAGNYPAVLVKGPVRCDLTIQVPDSDDIFIELGDLHCELD